MITGFRWDQRHKIFMVLINFICKTINDNFNFSVLWKKIMELGSITKKKVFTPLLMEPK